MINGKVIRIEEVYNGFQIECRVGGDPLSDKKYIAYEFGEVTKIVDSYLKLQLPEKTEEKEDD